MSTPKFARIPTLMISAVVLLSAGAAYADGTPCMKRSSISTRAGYPDPSSECFESADAQKAAVDDEIDMLTSSNHPQSFYSHFLMSHQALHVTQCDVSLARRQCNFLASHQAHDDYNAISDKMTAQEKAARLVALKNWASALSVDRNRLAPVTWAPVPHAKEFADARDKLRGHSSSSAGCPAGYVCTPGHAELLYPGNVGSATQETASLQEVTGIGPAQSGIAGGE